MKQRNWCRYCQLTLASMALCWALSSCGEPQENPKVIPSESRDAAAMATSDAGTQVDLTPDTTPALPGDRYTLDLASYQDVAGSNANGLWAPHQTVVVFPLDLRQPTKSILLPGPNDIQKVQTKAPCAEPLDELWPRHLDDSMARAAVPQLDTARVEQVKLTIPYRMYNGTLVGTNGPFCYGYRTTDSQWHWQLRPIVPQKDDKRAVNIGSIDVRADRVNAFAILFHTSMGVREIELSVTRQ